MAGAPKRSNDRFLHLLITLLADRIGNRVGGQIGRPPLSVVIENDVHRTHIRSAGIKDQ